MSEYNRLRSRCAELVRANVIKGPCSGSGVTKDKLREMIERSERSSLLAVPSEVVQNELFYHLSVADIYSYCVVTKGAAPLCEDITFWRNYLQRYDHDTIQSIFLDAAKRGNASFVRLLLRNWHLFHFNLDQRTLLRAYYEFLYRGRRSVAAEIFDRSAVMGGERSMMAGFKMSLPFDLVVSFIKTIATYLLELKEWLEQPVNERSTTERDDIMAKMSKVWKKIMSSGIDDDYLSDLLGSLINYDILWLFDMRPLLSAPEPEYYKLTTRELHLVAILESVVRSYIINLTPEHFAEFEKLFKKLYNMNVGRLTDVSVLVVKYGSYELYQALANYLKEIHATTVRDVRVWHHLYNRSKMTGFTPFLEGAYTVISPKEWYDEVVKLNKNEQRDIISETLARSHEDGYTAWHDEAMRLTRQTKVKK